MCGPEDSSLRTFFLYQRIQPLPTRLLLFSFVQLPLIDVQVSKLPLGASSALVEAATVVASQKHKEAISEKSFVPSFAGHTQSKRAKIKAEREKEKSATELEGDALALVEAAVTLGAAACDLRNS